jgi:hypothetical protein
VALWSVQRIESAQEGVINLECPDEGSRAVVVTLFDKDTSTTEQILACLPQDIDPCTFLNVLGVSFTPNDWDAECNPE